MPSKRVYREKAGSSKKRPLGISCYEDKLAEARIAEILTVISDGLVMPYHVVVGGNMARIFKDVYMKAKKNGMLHKIL